MARANVKETIRARTASTLRGVIILPVLQLLKYAVRRPLLTVKAVGASRMFVPIKSPLLSLLPMSAGLARQQTLLLPLPTIQYRSLSMD